MNAVPASVCLSVCMPAYLDASASDVGGILATTDYRGAYSDLPRDFDIIE